MPLEAVWVVAGSAVLTVAGFALLRMLRRRWSVGARLRRLARWWFYEGWPSA